MINVEPNLDNSKHKIKTRGHKKLTKQQLYPKERLELLDRLNQILGINASNNIIYTHQVNTNQDIQKQILELETDVKKYFKCSRWAFFSQAFNPPVRYMSLIKSVYKDMGYKLISTEKTTNTAGVKAVNHIYILCRL